MLLSWNLQGLHVSCMETFLRDLNTKIPWKVSFLQEFVYTKKLDTPSFDTSDRHLVLCNISTMGNRPLALIFHHSVRHLVVEGSRQDYDRGIAVGIHWQGINFYVGCFSLGTKNDSQRLREFNTDDARFFGN